ncbi:MAG TPA: hypothetical protein VIS09_11425 [Streptomyces sp.]
MGLGMFGAAVLALTAGSLGTAPAAATAQTLAGPTYRIVNEATGAWVKNFPAPGAEATTTPLVLDDGFASIYERWFIARGESGFTIENQGSQHRAIKQDDAVVGSRVVNDQNWQIESAGNATFTIGAPDSDTVWTAKDDRVKLEPANGSGEQRWAVQPIN